MIIDKMAEYWTAEMIQRRDATDVELDKLGREMNELLEAKEEDIKANMNAYMDSWKELQCRVGAVANELARLEIASSHAYREAKTDREIIADVKEVLAAITEDDYLDFLKWQIKHYNRLLGMSSRTKSSFDMEREKILATKGYESCICFLNGKITRYLNAVGDSRNRKSTVNKIAELIRQTALQWYTEQPDALAEYATIQPFNQMAYMNPRKAKRNELADTVELTHGNTTLKLGGKSRYSISLHKLLVYSLIEFTKGNVRENHAVVFPLWEYAESIGYDFTERPAGTPEEAEKEKKRVKSQKDRARREIKRDVEALLGSYIHWQGRRKGDFLDANIVSKAGIVGSEVKILFESDVAEALARKLTINRFPTKLLAVSGNSPNAYDIGVKLSERYYMDTNRAKRTYNLIGVRALLAELEYLPTYEEVQKLDRDWQRRIKEPFEKALSQLVTEGILADWEYTHAKAVPLTEEEAYSIDSYRKFEGLYLHFEMTDDINDTKRRTANMEKKKKAAAEKEKRANQMIDKNMKKKLAKEVLETAREMTQEKPAEHGQAGG